MCCLGGNPSAQCLPMDESFGSNQAGCVDTEVASGEHCSMWNFTSVCS